MTYRSDIDGLRALAVLPVVLYHAGVPGVTGGYVGVDVFFVISGFLITGIIAGEIREGRFSIVHFYERRARRILPALFTVALLSAAAAWFLLAPAALESFGKSFGATTLFFSNVYFYVAIDYFSTAAEYRPLLHTWSLAVEEQFYIVFPLLLLLFARFGRGALNGVVLALLALSLVASIVVTDSRPDAAFYLIPTRMWELMCGAVLALGMVPPWRGRHLAEGAAALGLGLIILAVFLYGATTPFPGATALVPCVGTALLIHAGPETRVARCLSVRPLVFFGLISYSLYLWHWPILSFLRISYGTTELPMPVIVAAIFGSIALATLSWRFVERPFRRKNLMGRRTIFSASAIAGAACLALSVGMIALDGVPSRFSGAALAAAEGAADIEENRHTCANRLPQEGFCLVGQEGAAPTVLLWGDSHAGALYSAFDHVLRADGRAGYVAPHSACAPLLGVRRARPDWRRCARFNDAVIAMIETRETAIDTVILAARWALNATGERAAGEAGTGVRLAPVDGAADAGNAALVRAGLEASVARLRAAGMNVILLGGVPEIGWNVPPTLALRLRLGLPAPPSPSLADVQDRNAEADKILAAVADRHDATFIPLAPILCASACRVLDGARPLYVDDDHLSVHGARHVVGPALAERIWR